MNDPDSLTEPLQVHIALSTKRGIRQIAFDRQQSGASDLRTITTIVDELLAGFVDGYNHLRSGITTDNPDQLFGLIFADIYRRLSTDGSSDPPTV